MFAVSDLSCNSGLYLLLDTLNDRSIDWLIDWLINKKPNFQSKKICFVILFNQAWSVPQANSLPNKSICRCPFRINYVHMVFISMEQMHFTTI